MGLAIVRVYKTDGKLDLKSCNVVAPLLKSIHFETSVRSIRGALDYLEPRDVLTYIVVESQFHLKMSFLAGKTDGVIRTCMMECGVANIRDTVPFGTRARGVDSKEESVIKAKKLKESDITDHNEADALLIAHGAAVRILAGGKLEMECDEEVTISQQMLREVVRKTHNPYAIRGRARR